MSFKRAIASTVLGAAALLVASHAQAANLITDPIFNGSVSFMTPGYFPGSSVTGWTSTGASNSAGIDFFTGVAGAPAGSGNFWDNGNTGGAPTSLTAVAFLQNGGAITSNTFSLAAGTTYTLEFFADSRIGQSGYSPANITVTIGGVTLVGASFTPIAVNSYGASSNLFNDEKLTFTTTSAIASSSLTFTNANSGSDTTALIDDVFLTPNAPVGVVEPGSVALLGAGLLGLMMVARRRRV